jgi:archaellum biogenesis protein FlaJ (TadC family)
MKSKSSKETFYKYPTMLVSMVYLILQFIISTVVAVVNEAISLKAVLIINFVLLVVMWILILLTLMAKDKIENTNYRQKDHYIE